MSCTPLRLADYSNWLQQLMAMNLGSNGFIFRAKQNRDKNIFKIVRLASGCLVSSYSRLGTSKEDDLKHLNLKF